MHHRKLVGIGLASAIGLGLSLHSRALAAPGDSKIVGAAMTNLSKAVESAEAEGYGFDDGTSIVGVMIGPGKTYVNERVWRRTDGFRIAAGKTPGDIDLNVSTITPEGGETGVGSMMAAGGGDLEFYTVTEAQETGGPKASWKITLKNNSKKPVYVAFAFLRAKPPVKRSFKGLSKAFSALASKFDEADTKIPVGRASLYGLVLGSRKSWLLSGVGLPKNSRFNAASDGPSNQLTGSIVLKKGISPVSGLEFMLPEGITNGAIQIGNSGASPTLALYSMLQY